MQETQVMPDPEGSQTGNGPGEELVGRKLGHYLLVGSLGKGGMGAVYEAEDTRLERRVALKVLTPEMAAQEAWLARFQREARAVAALNHPGIVTIHSVEEAGGLHFITMELVEGETLDKVIPEGGLPLDRFVPLAQALCDALHTAHGEGVIHRDLKPSNIMVTAEDRIKVLDFGLARIEVAGSPSDFTRTLTDAGSLVGTVPYMAPEQLCGKAAGRRSDLFSLGVVMYEMATGKRPFAGETNAELISAILRDNPQPPRELRLNLPKELESVISKLLAKEPEGRFESTGELTTALAELERPARAKQTAAAGRRWLLPAAALAATLTLAALGAVFLTRDRGPAPEAEQAAVAGTEAGAIAVERVAPFGAAVEPAVTGLAEEGDPEAKAPEAQAELEADADADAAFGQRLDAAAEAHLAELERSRAASRAPRRQPATRAPSPAPPTAVTQPVQAAPAAPTPAPDTVDLQVDLYSELGNGVVTVYAGDTQVLREDFRFQEKRGFLRRSKATSGSTQWTLTAPYGTELLRVYVAPRKRDTTTVMIETDFATDPARRLEIRVAADGSATAALR